MNSIIYQTGITPEGKPLIGGVWRLRDQEGFPLEMAQLVCQGNGWSVDWLEAMADASLSDRLPALMATLDGFLDEDTRFALRVRFSALVRGGVSYADFLRDKRKFEEARLK